MESWAAILEVVEESCASSKPREELGSMRSRRVGPVGLLIARVVVRKTSRSRQDARASVQMARIFLSCGQPAEVVCAKLNRRGLFPSDSLAVLVSSVRLAGIARGPQDEYFPSLASQRFQTVLGLQVARWPPTASERDSAADRSYGQGKRDLGRGAHRG